MLYLLSLSFEKEEASFLKEEHIYYAILWAFLSLFENDENIYKAILKLSFHHTADTFKINISIHWNDAYNKMIQTLLTQKEPVLSLNTHKMRLKNLKIEFKIFDPNEIEIREFSKFQLRFLSPTFLRHENILYTLPNPEQFLFSSFEKIDTLYTQPIDKEAFKQWLKYALYIGEYQLKTKLITIKKSKKCGCCWYVHYYLNPEHLQNNKPFYEALYFCLKAMPFVGMGSWTKLGCWNVIPFIS